MLDVVIAVLLWTAPDVSCASYNLKNKTQVALKRCCTRHHTRHQTIIELARFMILAAGLITGIDAINLFLSGHGTCSHLCHLEFCECPLTWLGLSNSAMLVKVLHNHTTNPTGRCSLSLLVTGRTLRNASTHPSWKKGHLILVLFLHNLPTLHNLSTLHNLPGVSSRSTSQ